MNLKKDRAAIWNHAPPASMGLRRLTWPSPGIPYHDLEGGERPFLLQNSETFLTDRAAFCAFMMAHVGLPMSKQLGGLVLRNAIVIVVLGYTASASAGRRIREGDIESRWRENPSQCDGSFSSTPHLWLQYLSFGGQVPIRRTTPH